MKVSANIKSSFRQQVTVVQTNGAEKAMEIPVKSTGFGSAINGGELLMLALATCFCNDIYREAGKRNLEIKEVEVSFSGDFGAEGEPGSHFGYTARVESDAPAADIEALIQYVDSIAEIHNTLRKGLPVSLRSCLLV